MAWSKKKRLTPNDAASLLLRLSQDTLTDVRQELKTHLGPHQQSDLEKMEQELLFFHFFALDYWISDLVVIQQERQRIREALYYHWREMLGGDDMGQNMIVASQERLNEYSQIVNEERSDEAKLLSLGTKLATPSGLPGHPYLLVLAPDLFTEAMNIVVRVLVLREGK